MARRLHDECGTTLMMVETNDEKRQPAQWQRQ
jgi:hypothetical protein